jgi:hypothetical protein
MRAWTGSKKCSGRSGIETVLDHPVVDQHRAKERGLGLDIARQRAFFGHRTAARRIGFGHKRAIIDAPHTNAGRRKRAAAGPDTLWKSGDDIGRMHPLPLPCCICEESAWQTRASSHIELDEATILWRNADIEQERRIAIFDLIEENHSSRCAPGRRLRRAVPPAPVGHRRAAGARYHRTKAAARWKR